MWYATRIAIVMVLMCAVSSRGRAGDGAQRSAESRGRGPVRVARSHAAPVAQPASRPARRGGLIRVDTLGSMDRAQLAAAIDFLPQKIPVRDEVSMYRIVYWTTLRDRLVQASGLLVVPRHRATARGVVAFLHGTNVTRSLAPSATERADGNEEAAVFGGNGYVVVLPDYIGLGVSTEPQPYMLAQPQVDATVDLLRAARGVVSGLTIRWNPTLLLLGFSQGGHSVAAVHRTLEAQPVRGYRLRASAAVAGAYALRRVSLPYALRQNSVGYLAMTVSAYASYYGRSLDSVFVPAVASQLPALLDGTHEVAELGPLLSGGLAGVFQPVFLRELMENRSNWFTTALDANATDGWVPRAPMRLYNGADDEAVSPDDAAAFHDFARARGGRVSLHSFGPIGHEESSARMYAPVLAWFDSLTARRASIR